ncbi:DUF2637 domain-containing protein (plasmid) [Streptomyces canus]|uniref:DUF2637 domain-containing protein n=1 Tax=Streptomyces canus TaxID=58343 RepID=UPI002F915B63|nr:DUF2637 domain-containing protein [Streptomyces canus]
MTAPSPPDDNHDQEHERLPGQADDTTTVAEASDTDSSGTKSLPLGTGEKWLMGLGILLATGVSGLGLVSSYSAVEDKAATPIAEGGWQFEFPWMLPIGIDLSILGFSLANLLLIRFDKPLGWVRWVPRLGTIATIYLNWESSVSLPAQLGHAVLASLWVVFSEIFAHLYAAHIGEAKGRRPMDGVRLSRWFLSPIATARISRQMKLWEITSYEDALRLDKERMVYRQMLRKRYGRKWRQSASSDELLPIKLADFGLSVEEALEVPERETEKERLRAERALFREAESDLRQVETEARIRAAKLDAEAEAIRAEGRLEIARTEAQNAAAIELRKAEEELRLRSARAEAEVAKLKANTDAEIHRAHREQEEAQLSWDAERRRLELAAQAEESAEIAEARARQAQADQLAREAEAAAEKAAAEAAESRRAAAESNRLRLEEEAKAMEAEAAKAAAARRIAEDREATAQAEAKAAELEAEARMTPVERDARRVAELIRERGDDNLTLEQIGEFLGVSVTTAHDRRKRARRILGLADAA